MSRTAAGWCVCILLLLGGTLSPLRAQLSTEEHLLDQGFWPTKAPDSRNDYVGSKACASCHASKVGSQTKTPMAETSVAAHEAIPIQHHPKLTFRDGKYQYEIDSDGVKTTFTVSDGAQSQTNTLFWGFGNGHLGQSYLFKKDDGNIYEARASYFEPIQGLDLTPTRSHKDPTTVEEAVGRRIQQPELSKCFACHTTGATIGGHFEPDKMSEGITCEGCHGPGASHAAAAQVANAAGTPDAARGTILNPTELTSAFQLDFCGACHSAFQDIAQQVGHGGIATARFQPFRLEESKCWGKQGDARLTCTSCHDPHQPLVKEAAAYDEKCLACHAVKGAAHQASQGKACPVATKECTNCHMVKINVPEFHHGFTDHRIRIARKGEMYPE